MDSDGFMNMAKWIDIDPLWPFFRHCKDIGLAGNGIVTFSAAEKFTLEANKHYLDYFYTTIFQSYSL